MVKRVQKARAESFHVVISALTIVETSAAARRRQRRDFVLSRLRIEPVTRDLTLLASELLHRETMSGHKHAIGAVVAATALQQVRPTLLYTSDPGDLTALCAEPERPKDARVIIVRVLCRRFAKLSLLCKLERNGGCFCPSQVYRRPGAAAGLRTPAGHHPQAGNEGRAPRAGRGGITCIYRNPVLQTHFLLLTPNQLPEGQNLPAAKGGAMYLTCTFAGGSRAGLPTVAFQPQVHRRTRKPRPAWPATTQG